MGSVVGSESEYCSKKGQGDSGNVFECGLFLKRGRNAPQSRRRLFIVLFLKLCPAL